MITSQHTLFFILKLVFTFLLFLEGIMFGYALKTVDGLKTPKYTFVMLVLSSVAYLVLIMCL